MLNLETTTNPPTGCKDGTKLWENKSTTFFIDGNIDGRNIFKKVVFGVDNFFKNNLTGFYVL